jgi:hypothetical protein
MPSTKKALRGAKNGLLDTVKKHPVGTAAVTAGAVAGVVLLSKAAKTAAKVVTIKAVGNAAKDVAGAVGRTRSSGSARKAGGRARSSGRATKARATKARGTGKRAARAKP